MPDFDKLQGPDIQLLWNGFTCPKCGRRNDICDVCRRDIEDGVSDFHAIGKCPVVENKISWVYFGFVVFGVVLYIVDIGTDLWLAVNYFRNGDIAWGSITLAIFIISALLSAVLNFVLSDLGSAFDSDSDSSLYSDHTILCSFWRPFIPPSVHLLKGLWTQKRQKPFTEDEDTVIEALGNLDKFNILHHSGEAFLEAAPQLLLQLYIVFSTKWTGISFSFCLQLASIGTSLLSLSWAMTRVYEGLHLSELIETEKLKICGRELCFDAKSLSKKVSICFWQLFTIAPRVLVLSLFASVYLWQFLLLVTFHIACLFGYHAWILDLYIDCHFCFETTGEVVIIFVAAITNLFSFDPKLLQNIFRDFQRMRPKAICCIKWTHVLAYSSYYLLVYLENVIMISLWYVAVTDVNVQVSDPAIDLGFVTTTIHPDVTESGENKTVLSEISAVTVVSEPRPAAFIGNVTTGVAELVEMQLSFPGILLVTPLLFTLNGSHLLL